MNQMSHGDLAGFHFELRVSPKLLMAIMFAAAEMTKYVATKQSNWPQIWGTLLIMQGALVAAWIVDGWRPPVGRWLMVLSFAAVLHVSIRWLGVLPSLVMTPVPVAFAAALISVPAAAVVAALQTALVLLFEWGLMGADGWNIGAAVAATWIVLGITYAMYAPILRLASQSWRLYQRAQELVEEVRNRREELMTTMNDLEYANRQLSLMNEKVTSLRILAEEAEKTKAAFVANVSHEFRTPLNMIIGLTDLLIETPEIYGEQIPPKLLEHLEIVHRNCEHLSNMVNDVLDLSQIEAARMALHREWNDLSEVINTALTVVKPLAEKKGLRLDYCVPQNLPRIYCDRTRVLQVLVNLLSNAARFTSQGSIATRVTLENEHVTVGVSDTGPGIAPADARTIFEPFSSGGGSLRREAGGTGLGLSISKQFVELHEGRMWLESEVGVGSSFFFTLPVASPVSPINAARRWRIVEGWEDRRPKTRPQPVHLEQRFVLCDETGELHPLFARHSDDVEFMDFRDLDMAVAALEECPALALLLNASTPDRLWSLLVRARQEVQTTPIIGVCVPSGTRRVKESGATGYLIKPVRRAALLEAIQAIGKPVERVLIVDDEPDAAMILTLNLKTHEEKLQLLTAANGEEALERMRNWRPDLVLLDVVMPDMDGWQVLAVKTKDDRIAGIPVILISAQDPTDRPPVSEFVVCTVGEGLSLMKMLHCAKTLPQLLLHPHQ